ncbi:RNA-binding motif protein, X-linked 2 [Amphibalanus amphitrite]|uniref:RNA-binding motif protein, X-linked 2 n=1 Tax=Amphibalanus amphitrite TaxID=1232801 RepID=A0A6A4V1S3_AMPAM|nr:RNA-binding motif protein, X-linked 2 [Amphibalanus amphitrite]
MNPLTNIKNIRKLNEREIELGIDEKSSWHNQYKDSAWIFIGGLPFDLTEGDVICVFSQYGEIVNINLIRDAKTGKSKGYCFLCYEDQRSTNLAVDNFNGIKLLKRTIRVDHVRDYKPPKDNEDLDDITRRLHEEGVAPRTPSPTRPAEPLPEPETEHKSPASAHKVKKEKKKKKKVKKESDESSDEGALPEEKEVKEEEEKEGSFI